MTKEGCYLCNYQGCDDWMIETRIYGKDAHRLFSDDAHIFEIDGVLTIVNKRDIKPLEKEKRKCLKEH